MSTLSLAYNRFGLGARNEEAAPDDARRWLLQQFDRFEARPQPIAAAPQRAQVAGQLADYLEETRRERGAIRRGEAGGGDGQAGQGRRGALGRRAFLQGRMQPQPQPQPQGQGGEDMAMAGPAMQGQGRNMGGENDPTAGLPDSARRFIRQTSRQNYLALVQARTNAALITPAPFVERMVHFWANHFAVSADKLVTIGISGLLEFEAIRPHVLGRFEDMLFAVERHPAMLLYLDQAQSIGPSSEAAQLGARFARFRPQAQVQRRGINENLAREILELHTLGVGGGYTQADVTEFARALTGWTVNGLTRGPAARFMGAGGTPGDFLFAARIHEPGARTIVGRSYRQEGEAQAAAVLRDLAADPRTARHLAVKLTRHFAGDEPPPAMVRRLEQAYLTSNGDLPTLYRTIIDSPEAWAETAPKFRTPWDWSIAALRAVGTRHVEAQPAAGLMNQLGQPVWRPGSPAGFDDIAASWAGPDALMRRVEAAERIASRTGGLIDARALGPRLMPGGLGAATIQAVARAESPGQGLALLLVAPEFLRR
jgi:uncharacterized protein (DUF1800 family)